MEGRGVVNTEMGKLSKVSSLPTLFPLIDLYVIWK